MLEQWAAFQHLLPISITHNATSPLSEVIIYQLTHSFLWSHKRVFYLRFSYQYVILVELPFKSRQWALGTWTVVALNQQMHHVVTVVLENLDKSSLFFSSTAECSGDFVFLSVISLKLCNSPSRWRCLLQQSSGSRETWRGLSWSSNPL